MVLHHVPKTVIRALDPSEALNSALIATKHGQRYGPVIALGAVESYFEAGKREQRRIERARASLLKRPTARPLFDEVHFYLICWARIAKLARFIANRTRFQRTGLVLRRYYAELNERVDARDHLEHFEERLPGEPKHQRLGVPHDLLNMAGQFLTYGGRKIDVGPASRRLLGAIVGEFRTALLFDSVEVLAKTDPNGLSCLVRRSGSRVHVARVMKQVQKRLRLGAEQRPGSPLNQRLAADAARRAADAGR